MEPQPGTTKWQILIKYSLIFALTTIAVSIIMFIMGVRGDEKNWPLLIVSVLIDAVILYLGIKARRDETMNGFISYGQSLGTAMLISLLASVALVVYYVVYFNYIDPEMIEFAKEKTRADLIERGQEEGIEMSMKFMTPASFTFFGILMKLFWTLILGLLISIFTRRESPDKHYNSLSS